MDFSKLSSADKQVVYAAGAVVLLSIVALAMLWGGLMFLTLLGGLAALAVVFMPQMAPATKLPGSRGSLLLISGGVAAVFWVLATLTWLGYISRNLATIDTILFLLGLAASLWLGWLAWQAFQAEGGKFIVGAAGGGDATGAAAAAPAAARAEPAPPPPAQPAAPPPQTAAPPPPAAPSEPMAPSSDMGGGMTGQTGTTGQTEDDDRA